MARSSTLGPKRKLETTEGSVEYFELAAAERAGLGDLSRRPISIKVLLESALRNADGRLVTDDDVAAIAGWQPAAADPVEIPSIPVRA